MAQINVSDAIAESLHRLAAEHQQSIDQTLELLLLKSKALDATVSGITIVDVQADDQPMIYVNSMFEKMTGYSVQEILGRNCRLLQGDDRAYPEISQIHSAIEEKCSYQGMLRNYRKDGTLFLNELYLSPICEDDGSVRYYIGIQNDVTEREALIACLAESEERYRVLSQLSFDYAFAMHIQPDGTLKREWITDAFETITGYTSEESEARGGWVSVIHPDDLAEARVLLGKLMTSVDQGRMEYRIITKSGEIRYLVGKMLVLRDPQTQKLTRLYATAHDITEEKLANIRFQESETRFHTLVDAMDDIIYTLDPHQKYTGVYGKWLQQRQLSPSDFLGKQQSNLFDEAAMKLHNDANARALAGERVSYECELHENGKRFFLNRISPLFNDQGEVVEIMGVARDITELKFLIEKQMETERLRFEFDQERELLSVKRNFFSMMSHEFRTPLAVIVSTVSLLVGYHERMPQEQVAERMSILLEQSQRMMKLVEDILKLERADHEHARFPLARLNLEMLCRRVIQNITLADQYQHRFEFQSDLEAAEILLDESGIEHILTNLLCNAAKYSPAGMVVRLSLSKTSNEIVLRVQDEGIGIPIEDQKHLFDPFIRGKNVGTIAGTGLGLAIVKRHVESHNGWIEVESEENLGTTFTVHLPLIV